MLNLDPAKLLVILVLALVVLGPDRLPGAARQLGTAWRTLTHLREQVTEEVRKAIPEVTIPNLPRAGMVTNFLADLTRAPTAAPTAAGASTSASSPAESDPGAAAEAPPRQESRGRAMVALDDPSMN